MPDPKSSQVLWAQLVADYRQACLLRRDGRDEESRGIFSVRLPQTIALWSREDSRPAAAKKAALESMFTSEQTSIDSWLFAHQALTHRMVDTLIPVIRQQIGEEVRGAFAKQANAQSEPHGAAHAGSAPRVQFDDIPGVIDTLLAQQAADYGARPTLAYS